MTFETTVLDEFEQLTAAILDGRATPADRARFNVIAKDYPEFRSVWLEQVRLHALLTCRGGGGAQTESAGSIFPSWIIGGWGLAAAAAILIAGAGIALGTMWLFPSGRDVLHARLTHEPSQAQVAQASGQTQGTHVELGSAGTAQRLTPVTGRAATKASLVVLDKPTPAPVRKLDDMPRRPALVQQTRPSAAAHPSSTPKKAEPPTAVAEKTSTRAASTAMAAVRSDANVPVVVAYTITATDYVWTGAIDSDFGNPGNWQVNGAIPSSAPANDDGNTGSIVVLPETPVTDSQPVLDEDWKLKGVWILGPGWTLATGTNLLYVGRYGGGIVADYTSGVSTISGHLRLGSADTSGPGWTVAEGGTLRQDGTIGRYAQTSGGGTIKKQGGGTLELNTGTSNMSSLTITGGKVVNIAGAGGLDYVNANNSLTVGGGGTYDLNGNPLRIGSLTTSAGSAVVNSAEPHVALTVNFTGTPPSVSAYFSGNLDINLGHNGTGRTLIFDNPTNDFNGSAYVMRKNKVVLLVSSPLDRPGAFGTNTAEVVIGERSDGGANNTWNDVTSILADAPVEVGKNIRCGTDQGHHQLGSTASATGTVTFSGNVLVGWTAYYNGNPSPALEITAGSNSFVRLTGNITNALASSGLYTPRPAKVVKLDAGMARLSGDNTYQAGTIVSNGVLLACSETALGTGGVSVAGGMLGGTATVSGGVTVLQNAALTAGEIHTVGTLTLQGGLSLEAGSRLVFDIAKASSDLIRVTGGNLTVGAPVVVNLSKADAGVAGRYLILDWHATSSDTVGLSDFSLNEGADTFKLVLENRTLYARVLGPAGTVLFMF